jgi:hypothetical protein
MTSTGPGGQNIVFRMRGEADGGDPQHEWLWLAGIDPNNDTVDGSIASDPCSSSHHAFTDGWVARSSQSPSTVPNCWFFGNDEVLFGIVEVQAGFIQSWCVGVPEYLAGSDSEDFIFAGVSQATSAIRKWYDAFDGDYGEYYGPLDYVLGGGSANNMWWEGANSDNLTATNCRFTVSQVQGQGYYNDMTYAVNLNTWSGKRPLIKPTFWGESRTTGQVRPIGTFPLYYAVFSGLTIGEELDYGGETYMFFPHSYYFREYGFAFRIA